MMNAVLQVMRPLRLNVPFGRLRSSLLLMVTLGLIALFSAWNDQFRSSANIYNIANQVSYLAVFACAQMLVFLVRGFDLSLGQMVSVVSVATAIVATTGGSLDIAPEVAVGLAVVAAIGTGAMVGAFNGIGVGYLRLNAFVVTLGSLNVCLGLASMISAGRPIGGLPISFTQLFYGPSFLGIQASILWAALALIVMHFILSYSYIGRLWYFIGGNPKAAGVAGVPVQRMVLWAYIGCSLLGTLGALMLTARTASGEPNLGGQVTLQSAAAAAIGGVSLRGGEGGVGAAVLGAIFITVLSNGMNLVHVNGYVQEILLGLLICAAASFGRQSSR